MLKWKGEEINKLKRALEEAEFTVKKSRIELESGGWWKEEAERRGEEVSQLTMQIGHLEDDNHKMGRIIESSQQQ